MSKAFYAQARFQMTLPGGYTQVAGAVIIPAGIAAHTLARRNLTKAAPHLARRILDPQVYLSALNPSTSRRACTNLASYGWFQAPGLTRFDSEQERQADWRRQAEATIPSAWTGRPPTSHSARRAAIALALSTQAAVGCEALILPSPLTTDPATDYSTELAWLDTSLEVAQSAEFRLPRFATVALSDTCLRGLDPWNNDLLAILVDQLSARGVEGAYVVIEQANENGYYCTHHNTVGALLRIVSELKASGVKTVFVSGAGVLGLLALAVGADSWSGGWYRGERRLKLADFEDQMGLAVPTFYSHALASDIHLEHDLDRINNAGLLPRVADQTSTSAGLLRALRSRRRSATVPDWEYRRSNVTAARLHFLEAAERETRGLSALDHRGQLNYAHSWLLSADRLASDLYRLGSFHPRTELNHQSAWLRAFESFLAATT